MKLRVSPRQSKVRPVALLGGALVVCLQLLGGCGQTVEVGIDDALTAAGSDAGGNSQVAGNAAMAGAATGQGGAAGCVVTKCRDKQYACGDCDDNDQDGSVDALDPECLGPCDDDEVGLSTGMEVGAATACRQDCYFDGDAGPGNDQCSWSHACDMLSVAPDYPPSGEMRCEYDPSTQIMGLDCEAMLADEQQQSCRELCLPLAPNGCDCFGCCKLPDGQYHFVGKGRGELGCQLDALDDLAVCPLCTPVETCLNPCEDCEACVGTAPRLGCAPGDACPPGQAACVDDNSPCDFGEYCVTGCCVRAPEPI